MKKTLILTALLLLAGTLTFAQNAPAATGHYPHYFGLSGGLTTGYGLSYRLWDGTFGLQVTALPVFQPKELMIDVGTAGLWTIQDLQWTRFFAWAGGSGIYERSEQDYDLEGNPTPTVVTTLRAALGGGVGFELIAYDHLAFDLMFGYQLTLDDSVLGSGLTVEAGLYYRL